MGADGVEGEEKAAGRAVQGPDALEVEWAGFVEGDHVAGEARGVSDSGEGKRGVLVGWLLLLHLLCVGCYRAWF